MWRAGELKSVTGDKSVSYELNEGKKVSHLPDLRGSLEEPELNC
jgi:hypothetical protein